MDESVKSQVKSSLLGTLHASAADVAHTAAMVVAKVGAIEIPRNGWPELIHSLISNAQNMEQRTLRQATLQAIGYLCEELGAFEEDYLDQDTVNLVLTAVVGGMRPDETDVEIKLAATKALNNALEFASTNFKNEQERNYMMQVICQETLAQDPRVRQSSWECLVSIVEMYYVTLPAYINSIFELTQRAVKDSEESVALQALEFWSSIAEEEAAIEDRKEIDPEDSELVNHEFIKSLLPQLVPLTLGLLTQQEEGADEDAAWNVSLAAGTVLALSAVAVGDPIVGLVMPFVQENIQRNSSPEDWRWREAATFAFGSILEGPRVPTLYALASSGLEYLLNALNDAHPQVKSTTAWTIGRIFEFVHGQPDLSQPLINAQNISHVVQVLLNAIRDEAHIAGKSCYAISQLAAGFSHEEHSPLDPLFKDIVTALLETSSRSGDLLETTHLHNQAFEAINEIVRASTSDAIGLIGQLIPVVIGKMIEAVNINPVSGEVAERAVEQQGLLCGVMNVVVHKLTESGPSAEAMVTSQADGIMEALLRILTWRPGTINEEALLAVGALTYACGKNFGKYMQAFFPSLLQALKQVADYQTCQVAVGVVGDICRALQDDVFQYGDQLMVALLQNLQSDEVHRSIKPQILSTFGDLALAVGDKFEVYLSHVIQMLQSAAQLCMELSSKGSDEEEIEYVNQLRQGIIEAWAGMLNGMSKAKVDQYLSQYSPQLIELGEIIAADRENTDGTTLKAAVGLLGDVATSLPGVGTLFLQKPGIKQVLQELSHGDGPLAVRSSWALQNILMAERQS